MFSAFHPNVDIWGSKKKLMKNPKNIKTSQKHALEHIQAFGVPKHARNCFWRHPYGPPTSIFSAFSPLKNDTQKRTIVAAVREVVQKNCQSKCVGWRWFLGYVKGFSRPKHSRTCLWHQFCVSWTWPKSRFGRVSFSWMTSRDITKSTHWEPVKMLRRLIWCWTSPMQCIQQLWAVLCHLLALNTWFWASKISKWPHLGSFKWCISKGVLFLKCSQNLGKWLFSIN